MDHTTAGIWLMKPFNPLFCIVSAVFLFILFFSGWLLRKRSVKTRGNVLVTVCLLTIAAFFVYKYFMSLDPEYDRLFSYAGGFSWWSELPLHLCNINMILIPLAIRRKSRALMSFCFFVAPLGAFMALAMPGVCFDGFSLLLPRMLGYYGTHFMVLIEGLALAVYGLYRPRYRDMPRAVVTIVLVAGVIFLIDVLFRVSGLNPNANYFYLIDTEGNFLLDIFRSWIPCPFLYCLPAIGILAVWMLAVTTPFELTEKRKRR